MLLRGTVALYTSTLKKESKGKSGSNGWSHMISDMCPCVGVCMWVCVCVWVSAGVCGCGCVGVWVCGCVGVCLDPAFVFTGPLPVLLLEGGVN